ncbi:MAG: DUF488 domain-containing protein [Acidobacteria bacterium]|nr:MAG: DUF488 domain-containing protein [Acidobacteriota bacterium]
MDELLGNLRRHGVAFVVDVRSSPHSRFNPDFSRLPLESALAEAGLRYVFMGDLLGGRPQDPACYRDGKVDYERVKMTAAFRRGIDRLKDAWRKELRICILCSEGQPERCHRSKLIGTVLDGSGIPVQHIAPDGSLRSQEEVVRRLTGGQKSLFGTAFTSRKRYRPGTAGGAESG